MWRLRPIAEPGRVRVFLVGKAFQADVEVKQRGRRIDQDPGYGVVALDLRLRIRTVPLLQTRQRLRQIAPVLVVSHDIPRPPHHKNLYVRQHRKALLSSQPVWIVPEMTNHRRFLAMTPFKRENPRLGKARLYMVENVLQGGIVTGQVEGVTSRVKGIRIFPRHSGMQKSCHVHHCYVLVMEPPARLIDRHTPGCPVAPDRHPDLDLTDILGQMGMCTEPACALRQFISGALDLDCHAR